MGISKDYIKELNTIAEDLQLENFNILDDGTCFDITYNSPYLVKTERFMERVESSHTLRFLDLEERVLHHKGLDFFRYKWNAL